MLLTMEETNENTKNGICSYCNAQLNVRSRYIIGDPDKKITLIVGYKCPKCGFMPTANYEFSVKNTPFINGDLKRLLSPIKDEIKTNEPSDS